MAHPSPRPSRYALKAKRSEAGLGLYADEAIPKGRFVIEYWGPIVDDAEAQRRGGRYLFELGNGRTIVGTTRANTARYANHACRPNCETRLVGGRIFIFSIRPIKPGDAITYDYGKDYFNKLIKPFGCKCASCESKRTKKAR